LKLSTIKLLATAVIIGALLLPGIVLAYVYEATLTVSETSGNTSLDMLSVFVANDNQWLADNGFIRSDARDTRIKTLGGLEKPHMVTDNATFTAIPVSINSRTNLFFTTGSSNTTMEILTGYGGFITIADDPTIDLRGHDYEIEFDGYVDTDEEVYKALLYRNDSFRKYINQSGNITAAICLGLDKFPDPATPPTGDGTGISFSTNNKYMAVSHNTAPYVSIYKYAPNTYTKLANPASLPTGKGWDVAFSFDDKYLAVAHETSANLTIYKRSGDTFTKLADPANLPTYSSLGIAFSPDVTYLAVAHSGTSPYLVIYKRSGDTFTKLADPANLPAGNGYAVTWSPDGTYLVFAHATSPFITIYKRSGDTFTKLANPSNLPAGTAWGVAFSPDGTYLAVGHTTTPYITIYKRSGDTFTKLPNPANLPTGNGYRVDFNSAGTNVAIAHTTSPYVTVYSRVGDVFTKISNPTTLPDGNGTGVGYSNNDNYIAVGHVTAPYLTIYEDWLDVTASGITSGAMNVKTVHGFGNASGDTLHFDGTLATSYINCGVLSDNVTKLYLDLWFKLDSTFSSASTSSMHLWGKHDDGDNMMNLFLYQGSGKIEWNLKRGGAYRFSLTSTTSVWTAGTWYHVHASMSDTAGGTQRLLINDVAEDTDTQAAFNTPNGGPFVIGKQFTGGLTGMSGHIANFVTGEKDLSGAEETDLYNNIPPGDETDMWDMDEGTGTIIYSFGSGLNNGARGAGATWVTIARPCDVYIEVEGTVEDTRNMYGNDALDSGADYILIKGNSMPYMTEYQHSVNSTLLVHYAPLTDMIAGKVLPDSAGTAQDGVITYGANPSNISVVLGSMVSIGQPAIGEVADAPARDLMPEVATSDWFVEPAVTGSLLTNPMRPFITLISDNTTLTELQSWRWMGIAFVLLVTGLCIRAVPRHLAIACFGGGASVVAMVAMTIFPIYALVMVVLFAFGGLVAERSPHL